MGLNDASRIWDAVDLGVSALESEAGRRAIVLLTDGEASGNRLGVADVIRHARASNVAVSVIGSGGWVLSMDLPTRGPTPRSALEALTSETGGMLVFDAGGDKFRRRNPGQFFERIVEALRLSN